ncbi:MAG: hypothetical protein AAGK78_15430, partial [Planctomycetota bacterium]
FHGLAGGVELGLALGDELLELPLELHALIEAVEQGLDVDDCDRRGLGGPDGGEGDRCDGQRGGDGEGRPQRQRRSR